MEHLTYDYAMCLDCDTQLEVDNIGDMEQVSNSTLIQGFEGYCPRCHKRYHWVESYTYNLTHDIEEIDSPEEDIYHDWDESPPSEYELNP